MEISYKTAVFDGFIRVFPIFYIAFQLENLKSWFAEYYCVLYWY